MHNEGLIYGPSPTAAALAEALIEIAPGKGPQRVMFGESGSSSNDGAIEAVRRKTQKLGIIHFENAYHGSTGLSQPASQYGNLDDGIYPSDNILFEQVPFPTTEETAATVLAQVQALLSTGLYGGFIAEIYQASKCHRQVSFRPSFKCFMTLVPI